MSNDVQAAAPPGEPPTPPAVPAVHKTLRQFWLIDFPAEAAGRPGEEIHALDATRHVVKALMREVEAYQALAGLNAKNAQEVAEEYQARWTVNVLESAIVSLFCAAVAWQEAQDPVALCKETALVLGTNIHSLIHTCMAQRQRCTHQALQIMHWQQETNRADLEARGVLELLFL
jgi:hypothetical protein